MRKIALSARSWLRLRCVGEPSPSMAVPGPWCLRYSIGAEVSREQCNFPSFEACRSEMYFWGSTAFCSQNPGYFGRLTRQRPASPSAGPITH